MSTKIKQYEVVVWLDEGCIEDFASASVLPRVITVEDLMAWIENNTFDTDSDEYYMGNNSALERLRQDLES